MKLLKQYFLSLLFLLLYSSSLFSQNQLISLQDDNITRLIARTATYEGGVKMFMPEEKYKSFWAEGWNNSQQSIQWEIESKEGDNKIALMICPQNLKQGESIFLTCKYEKQTIYCKVSENGWQRIWFNKSLRLNLGISQLKLQMLDSGVDENYQIQLFSAEIVQPKVYERILNEANDLRADTRWMTDIPYGFFFHWNSKSMPKEGAQKSYEDAVNDFNVNQFAKMVNDCGAKLIFFTTSWAEYYFPAPIKAIDNILPGRTTSRDLVADLSDALGKYGIKLILYYHVGHGDKDWWSKQNFQLGKPGNLYLNLEKIVGEISTRYGENLAGMWMDDGMGYYPNYAPFDKITRAAKRGNKDFVICYNPWVFPKLTEYQDYYAGEVGLTVEASGKDNPYLPIGGSGVFEGGSQDGLQATYTGVLEPGDWTHTYRNKVIEAPLLSSEDLIKIVKESNKRKNLPMMNVRIYQDGTISPDTYKLLTILKNSL